MRKFLISNFVFILVCLCQPLESREIILSETSKNYEYALKYKEPYDKAFQRTVDRIEGRYFASSMMMCWVFLADDSRPDKLEFVFKEALRWDDKNGDNFEGEGGRGDSNKSNWIPTLCGVFLAEYSRHYPLRMPREQLKEIVKHMAWTQEPVGGGWFKHYKGPTYVGKYTDLGILATLNHGYFWSVRSLGLAVPKKTLSELDRWLGKNANGHVGYGDGRHYKDKTGSRGACSILGLFHAKQLDHFIIKDYSLHIPKSIPLLNKGIHIGGYHALKVAMGSRHLDKKIGEKLRSTWLDYYVERQDPDGGVYIGDNEQDGGERKLLYGNDVSTAAFVMMIRLQNPNYLAASASRKSSLSLLLPKPKSAKLLPVALLCFEGRFDDANQLLKTISKDKIKSEERKEIAEIRKKIESFSGELLNRAEKFERGKYLEKAVYLYDAVIREWPKRKSAIAAAKKLKALKGNRKNEWEVRVEFFEAWDNLLNCGFKEAAWRLDYLAMKYPKTMVGQKCRELIQDQEKITYEVMPEFIEPFSISAERLRSSSKSIYKNLNQNNPLRTHKAIVSLEKSLRKKILKINLRDSAKKDSALLDEIKQYNLARAKWAVARIEYLMIKKDIVHVKEALRTKSNLIGINSKWDRLILKIDKSLSQKKNKEELVIGNKYYKLGESLHKSLPTKATLEKLNSEKAKETLKQKVLKARTRLIKSFKEFAEKYKKSPYGKSANKVLSMLEEDSLAVVNFQAVVLSMKDK